MERYRVSAAKKVLYLVRHAKSSWKDPSLSDRERPLNSRGEENSPEMGRRLAQHGHRPDLIISSPARRALTTARNIARELGIEEQAIVVDENLYFQGARGMLNVLAETDDSYRKVMMVGHNPTITTLANALIDREIYNMVTCAVAIIGFDIDSWAEVHDTDGELLGYGYPKGPEHFDLR
jgi:phosphohistidine phosphatase